MNRISEALGAHLEPKMAVIVYQDNQHHDLYLERRKIKNGKMGAGAPLTKKCISEIASAIAADDKDMNFGMHGSISTNLIYIDTTPGNTKLVWYREPKSYNAYFSAALGIEDGAIMMPGLLYVAVNDSMHLFAFKGTKPKSKLYRAPLMNVGDGNVCLGNAKISKPTNGNINDIIQYWEELFWRSEFSHILGPNPIKGNLASVTKHCIATGAPFPTNELIPVKTKLQDLLK